MQPVIEKPEGMYCQQIRNYTPSIFCPHRDEREVMSPKCKLFKRYLSWDSKGYILKCQKCLEELNG